VVSDAVSGLELERQKFSFLMAAVAQQPDPPLSPATGSGGRLPTAALFPPPVVAGVRAWPDFVPVSLFHEGGSGIALSARFPINASIRVNAWL